MHHTLFNINPIKSPNYLILKSTLTSSLVCFLCFALSCFALFLLFRVWAILKSYCIGSWRNCVQVFTIGVDGYDLQRRLDLWNVELFFSKNGPYPASFSFIFIFSNKLQFFQGISVRNVHPVYGAGIRTHVLENTSLLS